VITIVAPKEIDDETKQLLEELKEHLPNPRKNDVLHEDKG
jgi:hypothetical protein